jgi:hypothetical protein
MAVLRSELEDWKIELDRRAKGKRERWFGGLFGRKK